MKTIIAGSRTIVGNIGLVEAAVKNCGWNITEVVCGGAKGIDNTGAQWATLNNIPKKYFLADWARFKLGAGKLRNTDMAKYADALIAIWDGVSSGTGNMIDTARKQKLKVYVEFYG